MYKFFSLFFRLLCGNAYNEFFPQGTTLIKEYYLILRQLRDAIRRKRSAWSAIFRNCIMIKHQPILHCLLGNSIVMTQQRPYFPDLPPYDFFLSPKMIKTNKGKRFTTIQVIKTKSLGGKRYMYQNLRFRRVF